LGEWGCNVVFLFNFEENLGTCIIIWHPTRFGGLYIEVNVYMNGL
jgi:hypothetical protein